MNTPRTVVLLAVIGTAAIATPVPAASSAETPHKGATMNTPVGLTSDLATLPLLTNARTRSISAENPTGEKGKGGMAVPDPSEPKPAAAARAADDLGQGWKVRPFLRVNAGKTATLMDVDGPGVIQHIWMVEGLSRAHVLRFYWDGEKTPSIEVPVPDFFTVGHDMFARVNSLAVIVNPRNAMNCYWPMPFRRHARITLTNEAEKDLELLAFQIDYAEIDVPENAGTLHAQWRRAMTEKVNPYVIIDGIKGKGRYVGTFLAWTQMTPGWFGEGEIKFYIDGDKEFPTICGTGTEDYFCGSYGFPEIYTTAYIGTTLPGDQPGQKGPPFFWSLYRWHIPDPVCFEKDLRVTIQALGWGKNGKYKKLNDDIASVAYWYQIEPHAPFPKLPSLAERIKRQAPKAKKGALEGEDLEILGKTAGNARRQNTGLQGGVWSGGAHLWWTDANPGDTLDLALPVKKSGKYKVSAQLTKADDYGIVQLYLDGNKLGKPIDLYNKVASPTDVMDFGTHKLKKGKHTLRVEIVGANKKAKKDYMFGLDYVLLKPVE